MENKLEVRAKAAEIAASMSGDFKENFDMIYNAILADAAIPDAPKTSEVMEEVSNILKTIFNEYAK